MHSPRSGHPPPPPPPKSYRAANEPTRPSIRATPSTTEPPPKLENAPTRTPGSLLWPFGRSIANSENLTGHMSHEASAAPDRVRGEAAMRRVVTEGVLDGRYKPAARRVTALLVALPFTLYLSYELFQRRFLGKEQRKLGVPPPRASEKAETDTFK